MITTAQILTRMARASMGDAQDYRFRVRAEQIRSAQEYASVIDRHNDRLCVCGQTRGMHDITENFMQPCVETGRECLDFVERGTNGN